MNRSGPMKRFKHNLSCTKLLSCDMGELVPIGLWEVLPGDTVQHATSLLIRLQPMFAPVMHPIQVRVHHFFVPNRLTWPNPGGWEDFITGGVDGLGNGAVYPTNSGSVTPAIGSLYDYLGVPTGTSLPAGSIGHLPIRAYNKIFNDFYRDEDLVTALATDQVNLQLCAWEKDYFTTCRPWTQRGPAVSLPLGSTATVKTNATQLTPTGAQNPMLMAKASDGLLYTGSTFIPVVTNASKMETEAAGGTSTGTALLPANLYADLSGATAATVTSLRLALALQRFEEARAQYGARYTEYLRYCGVRSSDARLDRAEYLGGGKQTLALSEVLRTASDDATHPIGELRGHGIAALRSNAYRYFVEEHGYIMTLLSIRPKPIYLNGIPRTFTRRAKEDYFQKELELIGQQGVTNKELYMQGTGADATVFGYQDRYAEYRSQFSSVSAEMRTLLNFWHLGRSFGSLPALNQAFSDCIPSKRIFPVATNDVAWIMASHEMVARRPVGNKVIGRIL